MTALARESKKDPNFEIIVLIGGTVNDLSKTQEDSLKSFNARVMTFEQLIEHAKATYKDHLEAQKKITKIQQIVDKL